MDNWYIDSTGTEKTLKTVPPLCMYNQCNFIYYLQLVTPADVYISAASYARRRFQTIHLSLYLLNHYYPRWTQIPYTLPSPSFLYIMPIMSLPFPPLSFF